MGGGISHKRGVLIRDFALLPCHTLDYLRFVAAGIFREIWHAFPRLGAPAEVVLRLLILKHIRNWSYGVLEREVRANLVYRDFTRVGGAKMPDAKTMGRWGVALGGDVIKQIHTRMVTMAQSHGLTEGRRMRVDTTVVETNIHHPTNSSLLGDGVRVLIRTMKKITQIVGEAGTKLRDRSHSVKLRVLDIARAARSEAKQGQEKLKRAYGQLLNSTGRVAGQAKRFSQEIAAGVKRSADVVQQLTLEGMRDKLDCHGAARQKGDEADPRAHPQTQAEKALVPPQDGMNKAPTSL